MADKLARDIDACEASVDTTTPTESRSSSGYQYGVGYSDGYVVALRVVKQELRTRATKMERKLLRRMGTLK